MRLTAPRAAHQREGHERFTLDAILAEEAAVLDLADARDDRAQLWVKDEDTADLSAQQTHALARSRAHRGWCNRSAPAGAGKTTALRGLASAAHRSQRHCQVERKWARSPITSVSCVTYDLGVHENASPQILV